MEKVQFPMLLGIYGLFDKIIYDFVTIGLLNHYKIKSLFKQSYQHVNLLIFCLFVGFLGLGIPQSG